jgi:hypothetical protein
MNTFQINNVQNFNINHLNLVNMCNNGSNLVGLNDPQQNNDM